MASLPAETGPFYRLGRFIDARDSVNKWCAAKVVSIDDIYGLTIRFDGWSRKWEDKVSLKSSRIAPFRRYSRLYTGQTSSAIREWSFSTEDLKRTADRVDELLGNGLVLESAYETTQFLRGELFTLVDCLLTASLSQSDVQTVLLFFSKVIDLIIAWMRQPDLIRGFQAGTANPDLFLTDQRVAVAMACPELLHTLERLAGGEDRTSRFFKNYDISVKDYEPCSDTVWSGHHNRSALYLCNYFVKQGGLATFLDLAKREKLPCNFYARFLTNANLGVFLAEWKPAVLSRLQNLTDRDVKDFEKEECMRLLNSLQWLAAFADKAALTDFVENTEMYMAMTLLRCQYLEKRIRGLNELRDMIIRTGPQSRTYPGHPLQRRISKQSLLAFMQEQRLLTTILSDRPHGEILKRSGEIFCFYAENEILTTTHLDLLWNSRNDKHESYVRAVYEVLVAVARFLSSNLKDSLFSKFSEVPLEQYDEKYLRLLKDFSLSAVDTQSRSDATTEYALQKFFSLMLDDPKTSTALADLSSDLFLELLKSPAFKARQDEYLDLALSNVIKTKDSIPQSLRIVLGILRPQSTTRSQTDQIKRLDREFNFISSAVLSLIAYIALARKTQAVLPETIVVGRYSHQVNIQSRLNFLEFALEVLDRALFTPDAISSLWNSFITSPACAYDSEAFYKWLSSSLESRSIFSREIVETVFERLLCGPTFSVRKITEGAFACFHKYFLNVNAIKKRIEVKGMMVHQRLNAEVIGFPTLVDIAVTAEEESVSDKAVKLIVDLHMLFGKSLTSEKDRIWISLLGLFVDRIRAPGTSDPYICRILKLFNAFLDEAEGKSGKKPSKPQSSAMLSVYYRQVADSEHHKMQISAGGTIGDIRRKLAEAFKQHPNNVNLTIMNRVYTRADDDIELTQFKLSVVAVVEITRGPSDIVDPKAFLANHQELLDTLFELISRPAMDSADLSWELLMRLPTNEKIKGEIAGLGETWQRHLQSESLHKLLYCLIILDELSESQPFAEGLIKANGVSHLLRVFYDTRLEGKHSAALVIKFALVVFRLLGRFLTNPRDYDSSRVLLRTLTILWQSSQSLSIEDEQPQAVDAVARANDLLSLVIASLRDKHTAVTAMRGYQHMGEMIEALLHVASPLFGEKMRELIYGLAKKLSLETLILDHLLSRTDQAISQQSGAFSYFFLSAQLVKSADNQLTTQLHEIRGKLTSALAAHKCEKSATEKDEVLCGVIRLLRAMIKKLRVTEQFEDPALVQLVLHTCLFEMPSAGRLTATSPPKCKNADSRKEALKLLNAVATGSQETLDRIVGYLDRLHQDPHWRTSRRQDWNNHHATMERSDTGYVGIKNLGCTCYMSSILQQLFMIPSFREGVLSVNVTPAQPVDDDLLYQFQNVLTALKESDKQYVNPKALTKAFKPNEGQALNPMEQMDVDEFFNNFMDKIESQIKSDPSSKSLIQDHFGGLQSTELIGKGSCSHRSERAEPFLTLSLDVKNKKSIYESLDSFTLGEVLEGDNAYQCDHCDAKVTAERRVCIKHLPNILIFALRRFDFDFDTMNRLKLNDYCEFPMEIDLEPYTVEGMSRKDEQKEKAKAQELEGAVSERKYPDDYYQYKLRGIVVHMGTAESGHYYSFIADGEEGKWLEFNDTVVREFDAKEIPAEAFGGEEKWNISTGYGSQIVSLREKYRNAYLLFYERSGKYARRGTDEDTLTPLTFAQQAQYSQSVLSLYNHVQDDNQKFWRRRNAFSHEYFEFLLKLGSSHGGELQCWKFLLSFFLTIFIRSKEKYKIDEMFKLLKNGLQRHADVSLWYLETLTTEQVLQELLLDCPESPMRKLVVSLGKISLRKIPSPKQEYIALRLLKSLPLAKKPNSRYFMNFFELLDCAAELNVGIYERFALNARLLGHFFDEKKALPELPTPPAPQNRDIFLGYTEGRHIDQVYDKYIYATYESGSSFNYLYRTLARFPEKLRADDCKRYFISKPQLALLVKDANTKVASRSLGRILSHFCADSLQVSTEIIKVLVGLVGDVDYDKQKPMLRMLAAVVKTQDPLAQQRTEFAVTAFLAMIKENFMYIKATEVCVEFLYKLANKVEDVRLFIQTRRSDLKPLDDWIKRSQATGYPTQATYMTTYKQRTAQTVASTGSIYAAKPSAEKIELARKMMKGEVGPVGSGWDSEEEFPTKGLKVGDKVDVINATYMRWDKGTVVCNLGDLLLVRTDLDKAQVWVEADSDALAPDGSKTWTRPDR